MKLSKKGVLIFFAILFLPVCASAISNPSFEYEHSGLMANGVTIGNPTGWGWGIPDNWQWRNCGATNGHGIRKDDQVGWASEGDWSLYLFAACDEGRHYTGDYIEFYQSVDFTGRTTLTFDAFLRGGEYTSAYVSVDSNKLWTNNLSATFYGVSLDASNYSGFHELALGVEVFAPFGDSADGWTYFDNVVLIPEPSTLCLFGLASLIIRKKFYFLGKEN